MLGCVKWNPIPAKEHMPKIKETTPLGHPIKKPRKVKLTVWKTAQSLKPNTQLMDLLTLPNPTERVLAMRDSWAFRFPVTQSSVSVETTPWNQCMSTPAPIQAPLYLRDSRLTIKQINFLIKQLKEGGCIKCGELFSPALEFHHRDPLDKLFEIGNFTKEIMKYHRTIQDLYDEAAKCDVLCANCHRKVEYGG
jgi:hypothetical protein